LMWARPNFENRWRSSSEGWNAPLGWLWTVPTTLKSVGMLYSRKIACRFPPIVPGIRRSSVITPSSARRIAPNSFGYASFEAPRIIRRVFLRIAVGRWNRAIGSSRLRELLLDSLKEVVAEPDEPCGSLARGEREGFLPLQWHLHLSVEDEEALLRFREPHPHGALRREHDGSEIRRERGDGGHDDRVDTRVDDRPAHGHRVRRGPSRGRDDDPVRADPLRDLPVHVDFERADLRDVGRVDDRLIQAVGRATTLDLDAEPHPGLHPVVPRYDLREVRVDLVGHDFREEAQGAAVDPEQVPVRLADDEDPRRDIHRPQLVADLSAMEVIKVRRPLRDEAQIQGGGPEVPDPPRGVRDEEGVCVGLLPQVHVEHRISGSEGFPDLDRPVVQERALPRPRQVRVARHEVPDKARRDVPEPLHLPSRGPGDRGDRHSIRRESPHGVVGPVDGIEDQGPVPLPLHPPGFLTYGGA